jgi:small-conductance mechanosensitive channel
MYSELSNLLEAKFLGEPLLHWAQAAAVFLAAIAALSIVRFAVVRRARKASSDGGSALRALPFRLASKLSWLTVLALALRVSILPLQLDGRADAFLRGIVVVALAWQTAIWAGLVVESLVDLYVTKRLDENGHSESSVASTAVFKVLAKIAAYLVVVLVALDNMGVDITALVAGLGVGGIAIALAVQNIVGDLFSSMTIALDKPFVVGDFIVVDDKMGTVEKIGIKTTRVRALSGEQLVFGNSDLLGSRIQNFKRMQERRILFTIGVIYPTSSEQLEAIPGLIREAVEAQQNARFDRSHFKQFGAYSLDFETVYYVTVPDYPAYMSVQQSINLQLFRRFAEEGIEFAYPTQTLVLTRES